MAVEFPLYHHLFWNGARPGAEPMQLIGGARRVQAAADLLNLTLFGPTEEEMEGLGVVGGQGPGPGPRDPVEPE